VTGTARAQNAPQRAVTSFCVKTNISFEEEPPCLRKDNTRLDLSFRDGYARFCRFLDAAAATAAEQYVRINLGFRGCDAVDAANEFCLIPLVRSAVDSPRSAPARIRGDARNGASTYDTAWFDRHLLSRVAYWFMSLSNTKQRGADARWLA